VGCFFLSATSIAGLRTLKQQSIEGVNHMQTQKPTLVNVIAWTTLASGIVNLVWGLAASGTALATIVGVICTPLTILPTILGVFEIIYAAKLLSNPPQAIQPSTNVAIFEIACVLTGNVFAMVVGILSLVFYNDQIVRDYFTQLNGLPVPAAPAPSAPVVEPVPYPVMLEEPAPVEEPVNPGSGAPDASEKPKRARKVAKE
jgi:hypothetical protein